MHTPTEYLTLCRLRDDGSVTRTSCSRRFLAMVAPLITTGVLQWEHVGAGKRLVVQNAKVLDDFLEQKYPNVWANTGSLRLDGIAALRNSKGIGGATAEFVILWGRENGRLGMGTEFPDVAAASKRHGCFAFRLERQSDWHLSGTVALVENPDFFLYVERLENFPSLAILYSGRMSGRFIEWLADPKNSGASFVQYADYDPVGLAEYCRLEARLGSRVEFYIPDQIEVLFERYSNQDILCTKPVQQQLLGELRSVSIPVVERIRRLVEKHNAVLEQEALLLELFENDRANHTECPLVVDMLDSTL